jgi:hypothetical protein
MVNAAIRVAYIFGVCSLALTSCSPVKQPYLNFQVCLQDEDGIKKMYSILQNIARDYELEVVDDSKNTALQMEEIRKTGVLKEFIDETINIGLIKNDNYNVVLGNLGLTRYQILISVLGDQNKKIDQDLSKDVLEQFKRSFDTKIIPNGKGAFPLAECK